MFSHFNHQPFEQSLQGHISLELVPSPAYPSGERSSCLGDVEVLLTQSMTALQSAVAQIQPQSTPREVILSLDRMKAEILDIYVMLEHIKRESSSPTKNRLSPQVMTNIQTLIDRIQMLMAGLATS